MTYKILDYPEKKKLSPLAEQTFWRKKLAGPSYSLDLPLDYQRPPLREGVVQTFSFPLSNQFQSRLAQFSAKRDLPVDQLVFTLFAAFIQRFSRQSDLVLGWQGDNKKISPIPIKVSENEAIETLHKKLTNRVDQVTSMDLGALEDVVEFLDFEKDWRRWFWRGLYG